MAKLSLIFAAYHRIVRVADELAKMVMNVRTLLPQDFHCLVTFIFRSGISQDNNVWTSPTAAPFRLYPDYHS